MIIHIKILIAVKKGDAYTINILPLYTLFKIYVSYIQFSFPEMKPLSFLSSSKNI